MGFILVTLTALILHRPNNILLETNAYLVEMLFAVDVRLLVVGSELKPYSEIMDKFLRRKCHKIIVRQDIEKGCLTSNIASNCFFSICFSVCLDLLS